MIGISEYLPIGGFNRFSDIFWAKLVWRHFFSSHGNEFKWNECFAFWLSSTFDFYRFVAYFWQTFWFFVLRNLLEFFLLISQDNFPAKFIKKPTNISFYSFRLPLLDPIYHSNFSFPYRKTLKRELNNLSKKKRFSSELKWSSRSYPFLFKTHNLCGNFNQNHILSLSKESPITLPKSGKMNSENISQKDQDSTRNSEWGWKRWRTGKRMKIP